MSQVTLASGTPTACSPQSLAVSQVTLASDTPTACSSQSLAVSQVLLSSLTPCTLKTSSSSTTVLSSQCASLAQTSLGLAAYPQLRSHSVSRLRPVASSTVPMLNSHQPASCNNFFCDKEVFAACTTCLCLLCYDHFLLSDVCSSHNVFFNALQVDSNLSTIDLASLPIGSSTNSVVNYPRTPEPIRVSCSSENMFSEKVSAYNADNVSNVTDIHLPTTSVEDGSIDLETLDHCDEDDFGNAGKSNERQCQTPSSSINMNRENLSPSDFSVDGEAMPFSSETTKPTRSRNFVVKYNRNRGESYRTEKSDREVSSRRESTTVSTCEFCPIRKLDCQKISSKDCNNIRSTYFDLSSLQAQREWLSRHIESKEGVKKHSYFLPYCDRNVGKRKVCKSKFLATLGISERQVRTVIQKRKSCGVLEGENRGKRQRKEHDQAIRNEVIQHIDLFPRMESHYCRSNSKCHYLSSDLNLPTMYRMYKETHPQGVSISFYKTVFKSLNLKFHHPKKDLCGLCDSYRQGDTEQKQKLQEAYTRHIQEKEKVRELKTNAKEKASKSKDHCAAVFDLQQVIYVPRSFRSELFYKRRLACYNFTIYDLASRDGYCFLAHEGQTRRGSCEIASHLNTFLQKMDNLGFKEVSLFSDGCCGQNKNSINPSMMLNFVQQSKSIRSITLHFFETCHGQSEGDSMHSVIEKAFKHAGDIDVPTQLVPICQLARQNPSPYKVIQVQSKDITDWKTFSQRKGVLKVRTSEEGIKVDWTKFMQIKVLKCDPDIIRFKYSHTDHQFAKLNISNARRSVDDDTVTPQLLYSSGPPKISQGKYDDLKSLCTGNTPVISHADNVAFYLQLHH